MPKTDNEAYPITDAAAKKMKTDDDAADEIHAVPKRVQDGAHIVGMHNYLSKWEQSVNDPQTFWAKEAAERLDWIVPPKTVCRGDFAGGNVAWFPDGMLNVSVNCLDRHPPDHTAIIWEGDEPTEVKRITYGEALAGTCQLANALRARGVRKGDRVCLYMPMVPEAAYAMLACARIGAIHRRLRGVLGGGAPRAHRRLAVQGRPHRRRGAARDEEDQAQVDRRQGARGGVRVRHLRPRAQAHRQPGDRLGRGPRRVDARGDGVRAVRAPRNFSGRAQFSAAQFGRAIRRNSGAAF